MDSIELKLHLLKKNNKSSNKMKKVLFAIDAIINFVFRIFGSE